MKIDLHQLGKKFNKEWIFKNVNCSFEAERSYAILGPNGSGKSTLLKVISGFLTPTSGEINYHNGTQEIPVNQIYQYVSIAAPYLDLIEEFTLAESLQFQENIFPFVQDLNTQQIISDVLKFEQHQHKQLKHYSSGMLQRVKLILSILVDKPIVLLDEPATNLDKNGVKWYHQLIEQYGKNRLFIVASNREDEYSFCTDQLQISDYK